MSPGMPGRIGGVGPNSVRPGPALLGPTNTDLRVTAFLMPWVRQVSHSSNLGGSAAILAAPVPAGSRRYGSILDTTLSIRIAAVRRNDANAVVGELRVGIGGFVFGHVTGHAILRGLRAHGGTGLPRTICCPGPGMAA